MLACAFVAEFVDAQVVKTLGFRADPTESLLVTLILK